MRRIDSASAPLADLTHLLRREGALNRRSFLAFTATCAAVPWLGRAARAQSQPAAFTSDPFALGVASGDVSETGVVLWTKLAPRPLEPAGGMDPVAVDVAWEIAEDDAMRQVVKRGTAQATPQLGHSVHVEVDGLTSDRWYWYRFRSGDTTSRVARTRTLPAAANSPEKLRFAFASCQRIEDGWFTAYEHMAADELDVILHLGDYIYEGAGRDGRVRKHLGGETVTLDDYRLRYSQYHADRLLQSAHEHCPWFVTWDDHEVQNNYANDIGPPGVSPADFLLRRAAAYQAYYEMMPLRASALPQGPTMQLYRKFAFGKLANFLMLDLRQYRSDQPNGDGARELVGAALAPTQTMLGGQQREWLFASLTESPSRWNVLAQSVMLAMVDVRAGDEKRYDMDRWPGYLAEREQLVTFLERSKVSNPIALAGDIHTNFVNDLRVDDRRPETPVVATEFVGTSLSSDGNGMEKPIRHDPLVAENPCIRFYNGERGYVRCTVTPGEWRSDYRVVEDITNPGAPVVDRASFVVENGKAGAVRA